MTNILNALQWKFKHFENYNIKSDLWPKHNCYVSKYSGWNMTAYVELQTGLIPKSVLIEIPVNSVRYVTATYCSFIKQYHQIRLDDIQLVFNDIPVDCRLTETCWERLNT
jgi:hypothetical protein